MSSVPFPLFSPPYQLQSSPGPSLVRSQQAEFGLRVSTGSPASVENRFNLKFQQEAFNNKYNVS